MFKRLLLLGLFVTLPVAVHAQSLTDGGVWTQLFVQTTNRFTAVSSANTDFTSPSDLYVTSTLLFTSSGTLIVTVQGVERTVTYTSREQTIGGTIRFRGCSWPSNPGTLVVGDRVRQAGSTSAVNLGPDATIFWGTHEGVDGDDIRLPIKSRTPVGPAANTTVAAASNGASLPQATINVATTTGFPTGGTIAVVTSSGTQIVYCSGTTATTFTGCTSGAGTMSTGGQVSSADGGRIKTLHQTAELRGLAFQQDVVFSTIAAASHGQILPQATLNVASTTGFPTTGTLRVITNAGPQTVSCTGKTATTFTGCTGGTGTLSTGGQVTNAGTVIAAASNGALLPQATINVATTTAFPTAGTIYVRTSSGDQVVTCTAKTGTSFTGCTGGLGTMSTGGLVSAAETLYHTTTEFTSAYMQRLVPGQNSAVWEDNFPGTDADNPGGIERVHGSWAGGSIVSIGEMLVAESGDPDVIYAVNTAGTARTISNDQSGGRSFVDVAVGRVHILVADNENDTIFTLGGDLNSNSGTWSAISGVTLPANPIGIEWDPSTTNDSFIIAFGNGTLYRITAAAATNGTSFSSTQIGSGFTFNTSATQALDISDDGRVLAVAASEAVYVYARCSLTSGNNCDNNGNQADVCRVLVPPNPIVDCNGNLIPDSCDISGQTSFDCDTDDVPDECATCAVPVEMVFAVDTSGSMGDEAATLCSNLSAVISVLQAEGVTVHTTIYSIGSDSSGFYSCDAGGVLGTALGTDLLGDQGDDDNGEDQSTLGSCNVGGAGDQEDWGRGSSILAGSYPWGKLDTTATTVAAASAGQQLPQATITVANGSSFPTGAQTIRVQTRTTNSNTGPNNGRQLVTCTSRSGNTFSGCSGGSGYMRTNSGVTQALASVPLAVLVSDEGPYCGSGLDLSDTTSITNAIGIGANAKVRSSVVLASGYYNTNQAGPPAMESLAVLLANGTGGTVTRDFAGQDLVEAIKGLVRDACADENDCDDNGIPDSCELSTKDCNDNGRLDVCEGVICLPDTTHLTAVGQATVVYDLDTGYTGTYAASNPVTNIVVTGPGSGNTATYNATTHEITFTPGNVNLATTLANPYVVSYRVCDATTPTARCGNATMTIWYNDPPDTDPVAQNVLFGTQTTVLWDTFFADTEVYHGDSAADNDANGISTVLVSSTGIAGSFADQAVLADGSVCDMTELVIGQGPADLTFTAPASGSPHPSTCYVQVCEETPVGDLRVCRVEPIVFTVTTCLVNAACNDNSTCTTDTCTPSVGCVFTPVAENTTCGSPTGTGCDAPDTCNAVGVCVDRVDTAGSACGSNANTVCDNPDTCDGTTKTCQVNNEPSTVTCGDAAGACINQDFCTTGGVCGDSGFKSAATTCTGSSQGAQCDDDASDHCSGTSAACVDVFDAGGTACGSNSDTACDNPNSCSGTSSACLENFELNGVTCGDAGAACVNQDTCNGSGACTDNGFKSVATLCGTGGSQGAECDNDAADHCSGTSALCVDVFDVGGTACGSTSDTACDNPNTCSGTSSACLENFEPTTLNCGDSDSACVNQDKCSGTGVCTDNGFKSVATLCNTGASQGAQCDNDAADHCSGTSALCVDVFDSGGTACGSSSNTDCDNPNTCSGTSAACLDNFELSTVTCGDAGSACVNQDFCTGGGACGDSGFKSAATLCNTGTSQGAECDNDAADHCSGTSSTCVDVFDPGGTSCGNTNDSACDNPNTCSGSSSACLENFEPTSVTCGDSAAACVNQDLCNGAGGCADNGFKSAATLCITGASQGNQCDNDAADHCSGNSATCVDVFDPGGTACGSSSDTDCDNPNTCSGTSAACLDNFELSTKTCGDAAGACVNQDFCTGSGLCGDSGFKAASVLCNTGTSQGAQCDNDSADHCSGVNSTCVDVFRPGGTQCGSTSDTVCDNPDTCSGTTSACLPNNEPATVPCRADAGQCDVVELCNGAGVCPADSFEPSATNCVGTSQNNPCDTDGSDHCTGTNNNCVDVYKPPSTACGDPTDSICDNPDTCNGITGLCNSNFESPATTCRTDAGQCDVAEKCDGAGACPADSFEPSNASCVGISQNQPCDTDGADHCTGVDNNCVDVYKPPSVACGDQSDTNCDNPNTCNGVTGACNPNFESAATVCRGSAGQCDVAETCDGAGTCPGDSFKPSNASCTGVSQSGLCDNNGQDHCTGTNNNCVDVFNPPSSPCGDQGDTICDNPNTCNGLSGSCLDNFEAATTLCRAAAGQCDVAESCTGAGACAADVFQPSTTLCTGSSQGAECGNDPADHCAGTGNTCVDAFDPAGAACTDSDACTGTDACDANGVCVGTNPVATDDGDACTDDSCVAATGVVHTPNTGGVCNDSNACTPTDLCAAGACIGSGTPVGLNDNDTCTTDTCNIATGVIAHTEIHPNCCTTDADCPNQACNLTTKTCVPCVDNASFPAIDSGCEVATPVCVEQGSISGGGGTTILTCVVCEDNKVLDTQTDEGCTSLSPICNENVPGGRCDECNNSADCGAGEACDTDTGTCVICIDDRLAGTIDTGCDETDPVCDTGLSGTLSDDQCVECENDKGPGLIDWGCDATERFCDEGAVGGPNCHECETDQDCTGGEVCSNGICIDPGSTVANDDTYTTTEGTTLTIGSVAAGVAGNDLTPPGSAYTIALNTGTGPTPAQGTLTLNSNGTFTFVPANGYAGTVNFTYTLTSTVNGATDTANVTIIVNGKPRPADDTVTTNEDTPVTFDPRVNDVDPNGGTLTITRIVSQPTHGEVTIGTTLTYVPDPNYNGPDTLVYEVCDATNMCATATVNITVVPVNDGPVAGDDIVETPEDTGVLVVVLANDSDPDSANLEVRRITSQPSHGTAQIQPDDSVLYTPGANFTGTDALTYEVCDSQGLCDEAVVLITVTPVNDGPVAGDDQTTTKTATPVNVPVLDNDSDVDGDDLTVSRVVFPPASGTTKIETNGTITYTPAANTTGVISFTYEACDDAGLCDTAVVTVTVGVDNNPPEVADDRATTGLDTPVTITVLQNDRDADQDPLTLQQVAQPSSGTATKNANGTVTYTPVPGFIGDATFTYTACDDNGACATATVTVTVLPGENRPPIATDDVVSTRTGVPVNLDPTDNDVDPDGDLLALDDVVTQPLHGTVELEDDGTVTYHPEPGFVGTDTFEVSVADGEGGFDQSTVTVVVSPDENKAPIAVDDNYVVPADEPTELSVLANDSDPNGDDIVIVDVVQGQQGVVTIIVESGVTRLVYTPNPGANGSDSFTYTISDGRGGEDEATVTINFPDGNVPPVAVGESVVTPEDTGILIVVLANDTDADGDTLIVTSIEIEPRHGTAVLDERGGVLYVPDADYVGPDVFTYRICDSNGGCDTAVVAVEVTPVNDGPRANDDSYAIPDDEMSYLEVVLNDSDPELDELKASQIVSPATKGVAAVNSDGSVSYMPNDGSSGTDTFIYEVCDTGGLCDTAEVTVTIGGNNHNPVALDDEVQTTSDQPVTVPVLVNDSDEDEDDLTITEVEDPAHGTATIENDQVVYTPDPDFVGTDIFFYSVCDANNACATAFIIVEVTPGDVNTPPTAVDDTLDTPENTPITFDSTLNDIDFDDDTLTVISVTQPEHGSVALNPNGTLTYTPDPGYNGPDTFTVTISDGNGGTSTQNVLVIVTPADNRPPDAKDDSYDVPSDSDTPLTVLVNDVDPDGDPLTIVDVVQPQHAVVAIGEDGTLIITPDPDYIGPDRFSYTISDGRGGFDTAYVDLVIGDRDRDGLGDGHEVEVTHTDPDDFDSDDDGLSDGVEVGEGEDPIRYDPETDTNPLDNDTDDDGLSDGTEVRGDGPLDVPLDPLEPDTDGDGVGDGVEVGVIEPVPGGVTDGSGIPFEGTDRDLWIPDADPEVTTDPIDDDTDDDGLIDGSEDINGNGAKDGEIGVTGTEGSGETDAANPDSDGDGIQDGTELGLTTPQGTGTDISKFQPDLDPTSTTDPRDTDTDDGGVPDGAEDLNLNGYQDPGEIDPNIGVDDTVTTDLTFIAEGGSCSGTGGAAGLVLGLLGLGMLALRRRRTA